MYFFFSWISLIGSFRTDERGTSESIQTMVNMSSEDQLFFNLIAQLPLKILFYYYASIKRKKIVNISCQRKRSRIELFN